MRKGAEFAFYKLFDGQWILELTGQVWSGSLSRNHSDCSTLPVGGVIRFPVRKSVSSVLNSVHILLSASLCMMCTSCLSIRVAHRAYSLSSAEQIHNARAIHARWFTTASRLCFQSRLSRKKIIRTKMTDQCRWLTRRFLGGHSLVRGHWLDVHERDGLTWP